jgi:uncharacterized protein YndB with AHSA1/START domain
MKRDVKLDRFYLHPPERVWKALTDPKALAALYMDNDFRPVVGHTFTFHTRPGPGFDGTLYCEVVAADPPRLLAYTFIGGYMKRKTTVTWTLTPHEGGTLVRLEHTGFTGLSDVAVSFILESGWKTFLPALPKVLDDLARGVEPALHRPR